ncbi:unnamed protein product [Meloidogyne enterolobii]|uniref:Uncharacterized protein n=1 Tax=Meloidogyne enterolobii TaxID=390850 RepID=A0ACB1APT5_MELEN
MVHSSSLFYKNPLRLFVKNRSVTKRFFLGVNPPYVILSVSCHVQVNFILIFFFFILIQFDFFQ